MYKNIIYILLFFNLSLFAESIKFDKINKKIDLLSISTASVLNNKDFESLSSIIVSQIESDDYIKAIVLKDFNTNKVIYQAYRNGKFIVKSTNIPSEIKNYELFSKKVIFKNKYLADLNIYIKRNSFEVYEKSVNRLRKTFHIESLNEQNRINSLINSDKIKDNFLAVLNKNESFDILFKKQVSVKKLKVQIFDKKGLLLKRNWDTSLKSDSLREDIKHVILKKEQIKSFRMVNNVLSLSILIPILDENRNILGILELISNLDFIKNQLLNNENIDILNDYNNEFLKKVKYKNYFLDSNNNSYITYIPIKDYSNKNIFNLLISCSIDKIAKQKNESTIKLNLTEEEKNYIEKKKFLTISNNKIYIPVDFYANGIAQGYSVDIMSLIAKYTGLEARFITGPSWNDFLKMLKNKQLDLVHIAYNTEERRKYAIFSKPYLRSKNHFVVRKDSPPIKDISELFGKKVVVIKGTTRESFLKENYPQIQVITVDTNEQCYDYVLNKKADATIDHNLTARYVVHKNSFYDLKLSGIFIQYDQKMGRTTHLMVHKDNEILLSILNKALDAISIEDIQNLNKKWFGAENLEYEEELINDEVLLDNTFSILKILAVCIIFLFIIIVIYWIIKGRPESFSIKESLVFLSVVFASLIISIAILVMTLLKSEEKQMTIEKNSKKFENIVMQIKDVSNNLTYMTKNYIATSKERYRQYYNDILELYYGREYYPKNYSSTFWYEVSTNKIKLEKSLEIYNLKEKIFSFDMSVEEKSYIEESLKKLEELINMNNIAINAINGYYQDLKGNFNIRGESSYYIANNILYDNKYQELKLNILKSLKNFIILHEIKTTKKLNEVLALNKAILIVITILIFITIIFSIYAYYFSLKKIVRPINLLKNGAKNISNGNYEHKIKISSNDELSDLAKAFNLMSININQRTKELNYAKKQVEQMYKRIHESIEYASLIQNVLIPQKQLFEKNFKEYFTIWQPKDIVGGDIYLFDELNENESILAVIDCTGHGVAGAFVTMIVKAIERQIMMDLSSQKQISPSKILSQFNKDMKHLLGQDNINSNSNAGFDGQVIYINKKEKIIRCSSARNEIFYIQNNQLKTIKGDSHSIGYKDSDVSFSFKEHIINTEDETTLYLSTDGYWDQLGGEKERSFGKKRLKELLLNINDKSLNEQKKILLSTLKEYQKNMIRQDDITFIGIKI